MEEGWRFITLFLDRVISKIFTAFSQRLANFGKFKICLFVKQKNVSKKPFLQVEMTWFVAICWLQESFIIFIIILLYLL